MIKHRSAIAGVVFLGAIALCVGGMALSSLDTIKQVSPVIVYAVTGLIVSAIFSASIWMLGKAISPFVDRVFEWITKALQVKAMNNLINDPNTYVGGVGGITASVLPAGKSVQPPMIGDGQEQPIRPLMAAVSRHRRSLITGSQESGKTTVLMYLAETKVREGATVYALDPHAPPFKWPHGVKVIGAGRGYSDIKDFMEGLFGVEAGENEDCELNRRYADIHAGRVEEEGHPLIYIVSDEWMTVSQHIELAMPVKKSFFTETRKASIGYALVSHGTSVKALDLEGIGDLRDDFQSVITCVKNPRTEEHSVDVRYGFSRRAETEAVLPPGPYPRPFKQTMSEWNRNENDGTVIDGEYSEAALPIITIPANATSMDVSRPKPRGTSQIICQMHAEKASFNEIARVVYGSVGGKQTKRIKDILTAYRRI